MWRGRTRAAAAWAYGTSWHGSSCMACCTCSATIIRRANAANGRRCGGARSACFTRPSTGRAADDRPLDLDRRGARVARSDGLRHGRQRADRERTHRALSMGRVLSYIAAGASIAQALSFDRIEVVPRALATALAAIVACTIA